MRGRDTLSTAFLRGSTVLIGLTLILLIAGSTTMSWAIDDYYNLTEIGVGIWNNPDTDRSYGYSINNNNQVCGSLYFTNWDSSSQGVPSPMQRGFYWDATTGVDDFHTTSDGGFSWGNTYSIATSINDSGQIAAEVRNNGGYKPQAYYIDYPNLSCGHLGSYSHFVKGINAQGDLAGWQSNNGVGIAEEPDTIPGFLLERRTYCYSIADRRVASDIQSSFVTGNGAYWDGIDYGDAHAFLWDSTYTGGYGPGGHIRDLLSLIHI